MSLLYRLVVASACPGTHHRIAMDALLQLRGPDADGWLRLFLNYYEGYLRGAKAPDDEFKDFKNHVLHVREGYWGGAVATSHLWYDRLVLALRREYWADAVYAAGVLSHYVTDPLMPLHTGQTEEEGKVHRAVEWSVTKSYDDLREMLDREGGVPTVSLPDGPVWLTTLLKHEASAANEHYFAVLEHYNLAKGVQDPTAGMDSDLKRRMAHQIGRAIGTFARVLDQAIRDSRARPPMVELVVETFLATVKLPFRALLNRLDDAEDREQVEEIYEEVRRRGKAIASLPEDDAEVRRLHCEQVLRIPLAQLDAAPARATGMKYRLGESSRGAPSDAASVRRWDRGDRRAWSGAVPGASTLSTAGGSSAAGSEAASRVPVPSSRLAPPAGGSRRFSRHRRRRALAAGPKSLAPGRTAPPSARPAVRDDADASHEIAALRGPAAEQADVRRDAVAPPDRRSRRWDDERPASPPRRSSADDDREDRLEDEPRDDERRPLRDADDASADERPARRRPARDRSDEERPDDDSHARRARRAEQLDETYEDDDDDEFEDDEEDDRRPLFRPGRLRRRMKLQAAKATRAMKRGMQRGIIGPAAALGRAMKNVASKIRFRRGAGDDAPLDEEPADATERRSLADADSAADRESRSASAKPRGDRAPKFHLEESQPVVDAPSIGGKTARRLEAVGVHTVADLLDADPETLAAQLDVHWADAAKIVQWQMQTELAVRIPGIRGHDAQILAAVGVTSVDELATLDVDSLWELVQPFLKTDEAEQILRGGSPPDRAEVAQWLAWTESARPRRSRR